MSNDSQKLADFTHVGGLHSVKALLKAGGKGVEGLFVQTGRNDSRMRALRDLANHLGIQIREMSRTQLDDLAIGFEHQGVIARMPRGENASRGDLMAFLADREGSGDEPLLLLVLDEVQDPHNLGACLRSADATGVDAVITPSDNSVGLTPVVRKTASGAAESVPLFQVTNLQRTLQQLQSKGLWTYGAAGDATKSLYELDLRGPAVLIMGAEGRGLRRLTKERCDELFHIPMAGQVSSLNVSVAAGVALFEAQRQRR
ncbi:MAG: 23S rRNA (guanosine(2251)-2'-O)-methyltransferase RlmB [Granulosicoccus sp.]